MLSQGFRLGAYEIVAPIGAGGMGEVYRARDVELKRDVAVKILPDAVAHDADRVGRFRREAEVLAGLNHPNIAAIYGLEKSADAIALVLEFVPGDTLADRLAGGPLPFEDVLAVARQIVDALAAAHDQGIVHRDLKPANIKVTPEGVVKVLDFGLAKALDEDVHGSRAGGSLAPTLTTPAMTRVGVILGTAAYMAPEQARGKSVDKRADIWAFGVVLLEMLTGRRTFASEEVSDTLALVLTKDPDWSALPPDTPPPLRTLLKRCLQKDRTKRLADIADARLDLDDAAAIPASANEKPAAAARPRRWVSAVPWAVAAIAVATTAIVMTRSFGRTSIEPVTPLRFETRLPKDLALSNAGTGLALSANGATLVFAGVENGPARSFAPSRLFIRRLRSLDVSLLAGTDGAARPFFSPEGDWVGFFSQGALKKVAVTGGAVVTLCPAPGAPRGGSWGRDGTIAFASSGIPTLQQVPASGGQPRAIAPVGKDEPAHTSPHVLPGGRAILYVVPTGTGFESGTIMARALPDGAPKVILRGGYFPQYLEGGYLTYISSGTMFAVPFDASTLQLLGSPAPVIEHVTAFANAGIALLAVSPSGTVSYAAGESAPAGGPMMWLERSGGLRPLRAARSVWSTPRFSPDGSRVALTINDGRQNDIWVYDWARDTLTRVTTNAADDTAPVWTPDGRRVAFGSTRDGISNLYLQNADGTGSAERLTTSTEPQLPDSFDPTGRLLAFHQGNPVGGQQRIMVLSLEGTKPGGSTAGAAREIVGGASLAANPIFSPDGRWIAYASNESGRFEIFVVPASGSGGRVQISSAGGNTARWSATSRELFYIPASQTRMMRVQYSVQGDRFVPSKAEPWSDTEFSSAPPLSTYGPAFDIHPDGKRFVVAPPLAAVNDSGMNELVFILNFSAELRAR